MLPGSFKKSIGDAMIKISLGHDSERELQGIQEEEGIRVKGKLGNSYRSGRHATIPE